MKYVCSSYKGTHDELNIIPIGDLHIGSKQYNHKELEKTLKWVDEHRDNTRIVLMGDIAETATRDSIGAGVYEQQENAQQQIYRAKNLFWDYRDLIDGIVTGNHEQRIYQRTGVDMTLFLAEMLELKDKYLRYQGIINFAWNKRSYTANIFHGAGGGATNGGAMNKLGKQADIVLCDLYLAGHTHKKQVSTKTLYIPDTRNNKIKKIKQIFVSCGSALEYEDSYAEEKGLAPALCGFPRIILNGRFENNTTLKDIQVVI